MFVQKMSSCVSALVIGRKIIACLLPKKNASLTLNSFGGMGSQFAPVVIAFVCTETKHGSATSVQVAVETSPFGMALFSKIQSCP
jgi:acid phosphatase family membrane protein YuiD